MHTFIIHVFIFYNYIFNSYLELYKCEFFPPNPWWGGAIKFCTFTIIWEQGKYVFIIEKGPFTGPEQRRGKNHCNERATSTFLAGIINFQIYALQSFCNQDLNWTISVFNTFSRKLVALFTVAIKFQTASSAHKGSKLKPSEHCINVNLRDFTRTMVRNINTISNIYGRQQDFYFSWKLKFITKWKVISFHSEYNLQLHQENFSYPQYFLIS